jgi:hypothetical protein
MVIQLDEVVSWRDPDDEDVRYYGVIRQLDGDPPDAAMVMETGAWHRMWGHSTACQGRPHSLRTCDLRPSNATEKAITKRMSVRQRDKAEQAFNAH